MSDLLLLGFSDVKLVRVGNGNVFAIIYGYQILLGKFTGRVIDLGIPATADFPRSIGSSIHIKANPQLFEKHDTIPGVRNIIDSPLGPDWRYWSKNFGWADERSARRLISQINEVFKNA